MVILQLWFYLWITWEEKIYWTAHHSNMNTGTNWRNGISGSWILKKTQTFIYSSGMTVWISRVLPSLQGWMISLGPPLAKDTSICKLGCTFSLSSWLKLHLFMGRVIFSIFLFFSSSKITLSSSLTTMITLIEIFLWISSFQSTSAILTSYLSPSEFQSTSQVSIMLPLKK